MNHWVEQQAESFRALRGCTVSGWIGVEMAVRDAGPGGLPQWRDDSVPLLQLGRLDLILSGGPVASIVTYQNDANWGLSLRDDLPPVQPDSPAPESIFRTRTLNELPAGEISAVAVLLDDSEDITEVRLGIGGHEVPLRAGEIYEHADRLQVVTSDESILVQVDGQRP